MDAERQRRRLSPFLGRGFTLVELLVAIAITAILSVAIFGIFNSTSEALYEADSLAQSVDSARFSLEQVRSDLKQAGAFGTPDSAMDPQVRPEPGTTVKRGNVTNEVGKYRVAGLVTYSGWQDYAKNMMQKLPGKVWTENTGPDGREPNFDGIVLIGAYDYPFMFEVGNLTGDSVRIYDHPRGLDKLARRNLFNLEEPDKAFQSTNTAPLNFIDKSDMKNRILRLRDPNGFYQFIGIDKVKELGKEDLELQFTSFSNADSIFLKPVGAQDLEFGFPVRSQRGSGERYYASVLDVYWYHVVRDPENPTNFQLVRERLDGWEVMKDLYSWSSFDPSATTRGEPTVLAERVVDFQVWFDCTENSDGTITEMDWEADWNPPNGKTRKSSDPHHGCLDPATASSGADNPKTAKTRMGHVRLSIRTEHERRDLKHNPFPSEGKTGSNRQLETFDIHTDQPGATRVYTVQADFEMTNYAVRNLTP